MSGRPHLYPESVRAEGVRLISGGMSYAEVSRRLGASLGAVHNWYRKSRKSENRARIHELDTLEPGTNMAGVVVVSALGRMVRPGIYAPFAARTQPQLDRVCYRVRCAVCGAGMAPVSHARLVKLAGEYDVVNCVHCWKRERRA